MVEYLYSSVSMLVHCSMPDKSSLYVTVVDHNCGSGNGIFVATSIFESLALNTVHVVHLRDKNNVRYVIVESFFRDSDAIVLALDVRHGQCVQN